MQIHDFIRVYESKSDEELLVVAREVDDLTDEARAALQSELSRRGLKVFPDEKIGEEATLRVPALVVDPITSTNQFLLKVTRTYRQHFWLFIGLIAPVTMISFYLLLSVRERAVAALLRAYEFEGRSWGVLRTEAILIADTTFFISWTLFCIAYAGIASAVIKLASGETPTIWNCFEELLKNKWLFCKASSLLFVILGAATVLRNLVAGGLFVLFPNQMLGPAGRIFEFAVTFLILIAFSRLGLAIPIVLHEKCGVRDAIFRSDELTEKKWTILSALIAKSVWGGYIVGLLPFWIAKSASPNLHFSSWFLSLASVTAVALVEPFMFIGFSLIYVTARQTHITEQGNQALAAQST